MSEGVIAKPLHEKGFGFIKPDGGGPDVFMHVREMVSGTEADLVPGVRVSYVLREDRKGPKAAEIRVLSAAIQSRQAEPAESELDFDWYRLFTEMAAQARSLTEKLEQAAEAVRPE